MLKRTLRIQDIANQVDASRLFYPRGVLSKISESIDDSSTVKRIEFFAQRKAGEMYGILRSFCVAYSSERSLLDMADASNSVIQLRSLTRRDNRNADTKRNIIEDKLVLRRAKDVEFLPPGALSQTPFVRPRTPDLLVSPNWIERMKLEPGDRVIISNPIENYTVPPPNIAAANAD